MSENADKNGYSWEDKYNHVFGSYCCLWNASLNFIAQNYGNQALDKYLTEAMGRDILGKSTFSGLGAGANVKSFLKHYVGHHKMLGGRLKVIKAEPDEIVVEIERCGSKSMIVETFGGKNAGHYCRHCEVLPMWEQLGWQNEVDKSSAQKIDGENIGCRRVFKRIKK
jgi:hypothetical protein